MVYLYCRIAVSGMRSLTSLDCKVPQLQWSRDRQTVCMLPTCQPLLASDYLHNNTALTRGRDCVDCHHDNVNSTHVLYWQPLPLLGRHSLLAYLNQTLDKAILSEHVCIMVIVIAFVQETNLVKILHIFRLKWYFSGSILSLVLWIQVLSFPLLTLYGSYNTVITYPHAVSSLVQ